MSHRRQMFSGLPFGLAVIALSALAVHAHARQQPGTEGSGARQRLMAQAEELTTSLKAFVGKHLGDRAPMGRMRGLYAYCPGAPEPNGQWRAVGTEGGPGALGERVVLLVHGLDDLGDIWDDLAPAIAGRSPLRDPASVVRFEYPNDQAAATSAVELHAALKDLRARGVRRVDLVCHSMGGLVARDVLTREGMYAGQVRGRQDLPDVTRLILVGTPNAGSPFAKLEWLSQSREQIVRWARSENRNVHDLFRSGEDGHGEAADDLLPGSAYLTELNARPMPAGSELPVTNIIGKLTSAEDLKLDKALALPVVEQALGKEKAAALLESGRALTRDVGDGVVSTRSAWLDGADEAIYVEATHRGMVRHLEIAEAARKVVGNGGNWPTPPAIPFILSRLTGEEPAPGSR